MCSVLLKCLPYQIQKKLTKLKVSHEKYLAIMNSCVRKAVLFKSRGIIMEIFEMQDSRQFSLRMTFLDNKRILAYKLIKDRVYMEKSPELREGMFIFSGNY